MLISLLTAADVDSAQRLVEAAGWNQLPADWLRLLVRQPQGCWKATIDGQLVGTVTTICYDTTLAWIGMMLVDPAWRRQGLGRQLMRTAIDYLLQSGVAHIGLDATPAGRPLYEQLGFTTAAQWQRWGRPDQPDANLVARRDAPHAAPGPSGSVPPTDTCATELLSGCRELDQTAFGVDRWTWVRKLAGEAFVACDSPSYGLLRQGRIAATLGPLVACDAATAARLASRLLAQCPGACLWDVPPDNPAAIGLAQQHGFAPLRDLYRMWLGPPGPTGATHQLFAISDPATG